MADGVSLTIQFTGLVVLLICILLQVQHFLSGQILSVVFESRLGVGAREAVLLFPDGQSISLTCDDQVFVVPLFRDVCVKVFDLFLYVRPSFIISRV